MEKNIFFVRLCLTVLVLLEIFLTMLIFYPPSIHRKSTDVAWYEWRTNPSPETEETWKRESMKLRRDNTIIMVVIATFLCLNTAGIIAIWKYAFTNLNLKK